MPTNIRNRLIVISILILVSIWSLIPGEQRIRERTESGVIQERVVEKKPIKLGLDLAGGMHLVVALDESKKVSADPKGDIQSTLMVLRKRMDEFGVAEPLIQQIGDDRIVVELAGITDPERARRIVNRVANLGLHLTDETNSLPAILPAMDRALAALGIKGTAASTDQGVAGLLGTKDSLGGDTTVTAGPVLAKLIGQGRFPGEYAVEEANYPYVDSLINLPDIKRLWPRGYVLRWSSEIIPGTNLRPLLVLEEKPMITGLDLVDATAGISPVTNQPVVSFTLNRAGGRRFGELTQAHINDYMSIVLDQWVQSTPYIKSRIDTRGEIELGSSTLQEAQDLANTLKAGALQTPIKIIDERTVGASLGSDSIRHGIVAGAVGTLLVILIMIGYYAFSGVLAVIGLGLYILFTLAGLAMLEATLTLPGLAGIVLSIGIAVDANVLIFERIREELAVGKSVGRAVDDGFHRAMSAIVDSNVCTILTAFILFQLGTGPVRGFAITLIIGTLASMVTAIFVTRTFFLLWLNKRNPAKPLSI